MASKENQRILDAILKNAEKGEFDLDPYIKRSGNPIQDVYSANNLQEGALGKLTLDQFKGKVPNKGAGSSELQDFAHGLTEQFTPDIKKIIQIDPSLKEYGEFNPSTDKIKLNPRQSSEDFASTVLHENLHARDLKNKDYGNMVGRLQPGPELNKKLKSLAPGLVNETGEVLDPSNLRQLVKSADINDLKEVNKKGHTVGDEHIKNIINSIKHSGILIRYGGDEFVLFSNFIDEVETNSLYSVGYSPIWDSIEDAIQMADSKMILNKYIYKNNK